jgi:WD repeat-containing protein 19
LAVQIETQGNNPEALKLYERGILKDQSVLPKKEFELHNMQCFAGIARSSIKMGDILRG